MLIVEVGFELKENFEYYDKLLKSNGLNNDFNCLTHDIYFTNQNLDDLSENEMKEKCIRLRSVNGTYFKVQNSFDVIAESTIPINNIDLFEKTMFDKGYKKVFDTKKVDHYYFKEGMTTKIQLQEIDKIGLLLYFDNKKYYGYTLEKQRKFLIDEINSYGFHFNYSDLGLDKLRTLYYKEKKYSLNQNA